MDGEEVQEEEIDWATIAQQLEDESEAEKEEEGESKEEEAPATTTQQPQQVISPLILATANQVCRQLCV